MSRVVDLPNNADFKKEEGTIILDFYADWCAPCGVMLPIIEEVAKLKSDYKFYKIDIDKHSAIAQEYKVMSIPTVILMKNGEVESRITGRHTQSEILKWLEAFDV